jgi:CspA family cold shock protein
MANGTVKWLNADKGFGFITQEHGPDVFVHYSAIASTGFHTLNEGGHVEFEVVQGSKGPQAQSVKKIPPRSLIPACSPALPSRWVGEGAPPHLHRQ